MLSKRLKSISDLIDNHDNVADIGADHGKLIIYLGEKYPNNHFLGVENKLGPFNILKANIEHSNIKNIDYHLSDGISFLTNDINTLILAGMGGLNIISILKKDSNNLKNIKKIIVCANCDNFELLKFLYSYSYSLEKSILIEDGGKYYYIFSLKYNDALKEFKLKDYVNLIIGLANKTKICNNIKNKIKEFELEMFYKKDKTFYEYTFNYCINYLIKEELNENK